MKQPSQNELRYAWLSTPTKSNGVSCGCPIHFAGSPSNFSVNSKPILATEGALKASTVQGFKPEFNVVAIGGISSAHSDLIKAARFLPLIAAFDNDIYHNQQVFRQLVRLFHARFIDSRTYKYSSNLSILIWSSAVKGIDDAILLGKNINRITFFRWLQSLNQSLKKDVLAQICYSFI
jgi:hypothetical protein